MTTVTPTTVAPQEPAAWNTESSADGSIEWREGPTWRFTDDAGARASVQALWDRGIGYQICAIETHIEQISVGEARTLAMLLLKAADACDEASGAKAAAYYLSGLIHEARILEGLLSAGVDEETAQYVASSARRKLSPQAGGHE